MLSKRERLVKAAGALPALRCRVCGGQMRPEGGAFRCKQGHTQDVNRKGYLYLLTKSHESCYDEQLFEARRRVFGAGLYAPVLRAMEELLPPGPQKLLDAGCGEGWYLRGLLQDHPERLGAGIDISREAIEKATDWPCEALWCVGDLRDLPFLDASFTVVLDVLTPANYAEFRRVLGKHGLLLKVWPGEGYLRQLRAARGMAPYADGDVGSYLAEHGEVLAERRVTETFPLTPEMWRSFVWMTPLDQDLTEAEKEALAKQSAGEMTIDLHVALCRLKWEGGA